MNIRVCLICSQIAAWGKIGGFGTNTRRLGAGLAQAGLDVHVVVPRRGTQKRVEVLDGMTVHGQSTAEVFFGKSLYREIDADIYHSEEPTICGPNAKTAMRDRVHLVTSMDPRGRKEWWAHFKNATLLRQLIFPAQFIYESGPSVRRFVRSCDGVFVEATSLREKARNVYRLDSLPDVLPKPVPEPDVEIHKADEPTCIFVARFDPIKQPEHFFELAKRMPDVNFIAVGVAHEEGYQKELEKKYFRLPNLTVKGFVDPFSSNELSELYAKSWIFVLPSAKEAFPTAMQEASMHECAIVSYVDPFEWVCRFGAVVPPSEGVAGLERKIRKMIQNGSWRDRGKAGRIWNVENHSIDSSVRAHINIYSKLLNERRDIGN